MSYLVGSGGSILVSPDSQTTSVTITQAAGKAITVYSDTARTASVAMPDTITTNTTYYLAEDDQYTISCQVSSVEAAKLGTQVGAATLRISGNTHISVGVDQATVDRETSAGGLALKTALDTAREYSVEAGGTVTGTEATLPVTAAFPSATENDLTIPAVLADCVVTVNTTGLYVVFPSVHWTTLAGTTGFRRVELQDGDGNYFFSHYVKAADATSFGNQSLPSQLMWLPAGLQLTARARLLSSPTSDESVTVFFDFYRVG